MKLKIGLVLILLASAVSLFFYKERADEFVELSSKDNDVYRQCFEEMCKKKVEEFSQEHPSYIGVVNKALKLRIKDFVKQYEKNEFEIQRLVKVKTGEVISGKLNGKTDFGFFDIPEVFSYYRAVRDSNTGSESLEEFLKKDFTSFDHETFKKNSKLLSWAKKRFLFKEISDFSEISERSDLERLSKELKPGVSDYKTRLRLLSEDMVVLLNKKNLHWTLGYNLKGSVWAEDFYMEEGFLDERNFMEALRGVVLFKMILEVVEIPTTPRVIKTFFEKAVKTKDYKSIYHQEHMSDVFMSFDRKCIESIQDELYWANSDLRNRAAEMYFSDFKETTKAMFSFDDPVIEQKFLRHVDRLELFKSRSLQEAKAFYPFYFRKLLSGQKKSIEVLNADNYKQTVLFLYSYIKSLPKYDEVDSEYEFVDKISTFNQACRPFGKYASMEGSFFLPFRKFLYLGLSRVRFLNSGLAALGHELGHGVSSFFRFDRTGGYKGAVRSRVWNRRKCIDKYYPDSKREEGKERRQTEEDWADYFAVELIKEYKKEKKKDLGWLKQHFGCGFVKPFDMNGEYSHPMKPYSEEGYIDKHSSNLFRIIAQKYYSEGELGPVCQRLAKEETRLYEKCD